MTNNGDSLLSRISSVIEEAMPRLSAKIAKNLLWLAVGPLLVGCAKPNSEPPIYYEPPLSSEASVRPAIVEGTLEEVRWRGGFPRVLYEPDTIDQFCAYVFSIDGQVVGDRADCTGAVPITPGKHRIAARLQGDRYTRRGKQTLSPSTATLVFDAEEGRHYKISLDGLYDNIVEGVRGRVWITDVTTQTSVTEARLVTSKMGPEGTPSWGGSSISPGGKVALP